MTSRYFGLKMQDSTIAVSLNFFKKGKIKALYKNIYSSLIHNCQKLETPKWYTQVVFLKFIFFSNTHTGHTFESQLNFI